MNDLISRQTPLDIYKASWYAERMEDLSPAQPEKRTEECTETHACDSISRQAAIDTILGQPPEPHYPSWYAEQIRAMPSVQPEPLSDAYMNAVWAWLIDYQIKAAKLKGRYTPYEVLSWVANDWRKEHEGHDLQTGGDNPIVTQ